MTETKKKPDIESLRMTFQAERLALKRATDTLAQANSAFYDAKFALEKATERYNKAAAALACAVDDTTPKPEPLVAVDASASPEAR